jgi:hypothetical protein
MIRLRSRPLLSTVVLALVMAATRYHHFGDALHLPDASLAVFFLTGVLALPFAVFPILLLEAGVIDFLAIGMGGVSDYCVSPAYWFLIPTYGVLWLAGRWHGARHEARWKALPPLYAMLFVSVGVAFLISNGSFYAFSGRFPEMDLAEYAALVARYYPPYALTAFGYVTLAIVLYALVTRLRRISGPRQGRIALMLPHHD